MPKRGIWIATVAILLLGLLAIIWSISPTERKRREVMERLEIGDPGARVAELLGEPGARCPASSLDHLRSGFPQGWTPAAIDVALQRLSEETQERWVYPVRSGQTADCGIATDQTEIGIGPDQRVMWYQAITGKTTLRLPDTLAPAGPAVAVEGSATDD